MANNKLRKYELIYLVQPEASDDDRQKVQARVDAVLEEYGATMVEREDWGKRKLAYEIQKQNKAFYTYLVFIAKSGTTAEIERVLRMLDNCIRWQTIKLEDGIRPDEIARHLPAEAQPEAAEPEAPQPEAPQPEAPQPEAPQPEAPQPEAAKVEAAKVEAAKEDDNA